MNNGDIIHELQCSCSSIDWCHIDSNNSCKDPVIIFSDVFMVNRPLHKQQSATTTAIIVTIDAAAQLKFKMMRDEKKLWKPMLP